MKLYMFRTVRMSIIRSLFTLHSTMVHFIQVCKQLSNRIRMELYFHPSPARKLSTNLYYIRIPLLSLEWLNSWWWTDELSETCRVSCQNKFIKLVHLVGFIMKKFVTKHGHINVKKPKISQSEFFFSETCYFRLHCSSTWSQRRKSG